MNALHKEAILDGLLEEWDVLDQVLSSVSGDAWFTPTALPGWTVHDVTAHLIGTE
ncbi:MAG: maleylpyruvate isomerase N-terminal domain-containing protein, partial [Rhodococcus sp. (in: high G+C Gram-positive bacteria)]|uniref:maleylpyruvate isomerase N-terminal domain-containing protein n=1 Tax=Rhodococcus sp. TaxID=1831 RepID=UPI003BAFDA09